MRSLFLTVFFIFSCASEKVRSPARGLDQSEAPIAYVDLPGAPPLALWTREGDPFPAFSVFIDLEGLPFEARILLPKLMRERVTKLADQTYEAPLLKESLWRSSRSFYSLVFFSQNDPAKLHLPRLFSLFFSEPSLSESSLLQKEISSLFLSELKDRPLQTQSSLHFRTLIESCGETLDTSMVSKETWRALSTSSVPSFQSKLSQWIRATHTSKNMSLSMLGSPLTSSSFLTFYRGFSWPKPNASVAANGVKERSEAAFVDEKEILSDPQKNFFFLDEASDEKASHMISLSHHVELSKGMEGASVFLDLVDKEELLSRQISAYSGDIQHRTEVSLHSKGLCLHKNLILPAKVDAKSLGTISRLIDVEISDSMRSFELSPGEPRKLAVSRGLSRSFFSPTRTEDVAWYMSWLAHQYTIPAEPLKIKANSHVLSLPSATPTSTSQPWKSSENRTEMNATSPLFFLKAYKEAYSPFRSTLGQQKEALPWRQMVERGQAATWLLLGSSCTMPSSAMHNGRAFWSLAAAEHMKRVYGLEAEPWISADGAGLVLRASPAKEEPYDRFLRRVKQNMLSSLLLEDLDKVTLWPKWNELVQKPDMIFLSSVSEALHTSIRLTPPWYYSPFFSELDPVHVDSTGKLFSTPPSWASRAAGREAYFPGLRFAALLQNDLLGSAQLLTLESFFTSTSASPCEHEKTSSSIEARNLNGDEVGIVHSLLLPSKQHVQLSAIFPISVQEKSAAQALAFFLNQSPWIDPTKILETKANVLDAGSHSLLVVSLVVPTQNLADISAYFIDSLKKNVLSLSKNSNAAFLLSRWDIKNKQNDSDPRFRLLHLFRDGGDGELSSAEKSSVAHIQKWVERLVKKKLTWTSSLDKGKP